MKYVPTDFPLGVAEPSEPLEDKRDSQCWRKGWRKENEQQLERWEKQQKSEFP